MVTINKRQQGMLLDMFLYEKEWYIKILEPQPSDIRRSIDACQHVYPSIDIFYLCILTCNYFHLYNKYRFSLFYVIHRQKLFIV